MELFDSLNSVLILFSLVFRVFGLSTTQAIVVLVLVTIAFFFRNRILYLKQILQWFSALVGLGFIVAGVRTHCEFLACFPLFGFSIPFFVLAAPAMVSLKRKIFQSLGISRKEFVISAGIIAVLMFGYYAYNRVLASVIHPQYDFLYVYSAEASGESFLEPGRGTHWYAVTDNKVVNQRALIQEQIQANIRKLEIEKEEIIAQKERQIMLDRIGQYTAELESNKQSMSDTFDIFIKNKKDQLTSIRQAPDPSIYRYEVRTGKTYRVPFAEAERYRVNPSTISADGYAFLTEDPCLNGIFWPIVMGDSASACTRMVLKNTRFPYQRKIIPHLYSKYFLGWIEAKATAQ